MSREIKRVALDFEWPLDKVWRGYLNDRPNLAVPCDECDGSGSSAMTRYLHDQWYGKVPFVPEDRGSVPLQPRDPAVWSFATRNVTNSPGFHGTGDAAILREANRLCSMWNEQWNHHINEADVTALIEAGRLYDLTHDFIQGQGWTPKDPMPVITPADVNAWNILTMGHDSINAWVCVRAECARRGHSTLCHHCQGEGETWPSSEAQAHYEAWTQTQPPEGPGYQLWGTVNEGCPLSPVFETPEALADWLVAHRPKENQTKAQWLAFMRAGGWAPTLLGNPGNMVNGVSAVAQHQRDEEAADF